MKLFRFQKLNIKYEMVEDRAFTDVLYPESIYDVIDYILRECIKREQPIRKCKNCQKYFAIRGRTDTEYCSRPIDDMGRTCRDLGASYLWERKKRMMRYSKFTDGNIRNVSHGSRAKKSRRRIFTHGLRKQDSRRNCVIVGR